MVSPTTPIYDSLIAAFYSFQEPKNKQPLVTRIAVYTAFLDFLSQEYRRVLANNLLDASIQAFRNHFTPQQFTDEKVIDSLLWAYVAHTGRLSPKS